MSLELMSDRKFWNCLDPAASLMPGVSISFTLNVSVEMGYSLILVV